jgi:hypothetical protein
MGDCLDFTDRFIDLPKLFELLAEGVVVGMPSEATKTHMFSFGFTANTLDLCPPDE